MYIFLQRTSRNRCRSNGHMVSALPIPIPIYIKAQIRKKQDELTKEFRNAHRHGSSTLKQNIEKPACLKLGIELTTKSKMNGNRNGTQYKRDNWTRRFIKVSYFFRKSKVRNCLLLRATSDRTRNIRFVQEKSWDVR